MTIHFRQFTYTEVMNNVEQIVEFTTNSFLKNHEITKHSYETTEPRYKHDFIHLFKEHVFDMIEEIERNKGCFFIAEDDKNVVAFSVGRPYGLPALSRDFMKKVFENKSNFSKVMSDWWKLMEKFQVHGDDAPPARVYHQALMAVDPTYAGKGIGTNLSEFVMQTIEKMGFVALAIETSSAASHRVVEHLKERNIWVIDIDSVVNSETNVSLISHLQLTLHPEAKKVNYWFLKKKLPDQVDLADYKYLMTWPHYTLSTNDNAKALFEALEELVLLKKKATHYVTKEKIEKRIEELEAVIKKELNGPDRVNGTPVQGAAHADDLATLKKLIARGADLDKPEPFYGGTVLHVAVDGGSEECVAEILQHAPHLAKRRNRYGVSALDWAKTLQSRKGGYQEIIEIIQKVATH